MPLYKYGRNWGNRANQTRQDKVNIVGHSKGGLDARVFLADNITRNDVANLIMIGTPNAGSPLADLVVEESLSYIEGTYGPIFASYWLCTPALLDLRTNASDTNATQNPNTNYLLYYCRKLDAVLFAPVLLGLAS